MNPEMCRAVLDSAANKTPCGGSWFNIFQQSLMKKNIKMFSQKVTTNINSVMVHTLQLSVELQYP